MNKDVILSDKVVGELQVYQAAIREAEMHAAVARDAYSMRVRLAVMESEGGLDIGKDGRRAWVDSRFIVHIVEEEKKDGRGNDQGGGRPAG